jgi:tetratricopeptide (TPR) repeat protein
LPRGGKNTPVDISLRKPFPRLLALLISLPVAGVIFFTAGKDGLADALNRSHDPGNWLRAAQIEPQYGEYWRHLGHYRQYDLDDADPLLATEYYQKAVRADPRSSRYWMDLGGSFEQNNQPQLADEAFQRAIADYPISAEVKWNYGNFLLRREQISAGIAQLHQAIVIDPKLRPLAISRCWQSQPDVSILLDSLLPAQPDAYLDALDFMASARDLPAGLKIWDRLLALKQPFPMESTFTFFNAMIQSGQTDDGLRMWRQAYDANGLAYDHVYDQGADHSAIWNGGFEHEVVNGGFDWRLFGIPDVLVQPDTAIFHTGKRSMRIDFGGGVNTDFFHLFQFVAVQPSQKYHFRAWLRTQNITTDSGVRFYLGDPEGNGEVHLLTASITGTTGWTPVDADVETGPNTHVLLLQVRRLPSRAFDNRIDGTAWVDDVSLIPVAGTNDGSPNEGQKP